AAVIWARPALLLRAQVIKVREFQHVAAAQAMGAAPWYILGRHLLPRLTPLLVAQFVRAANVAVFLEAAMAFLGLGDPNRVSWGTMLFFANASSAFLTDAWLWWVLPVGLALTMTIVGFAFLGYAVETWADPRLQTNPFSPRTAWLPTTSKVEPPPDQRMVLEVRNLTVGYKIAEGLVRAVDGVDFTVAPRRIVGLVGESGCGKSTLSGALLRLTRPPGRWLAGTIFLNQQNIAGLTRREMTRLRGRDISLIPQNAMNALNPTYTIHRQVAEVARLGQSEVEASRQAHEMLAWVGLPEMRHGAFPHELSGGMRQRAVIAMAVINKPALLVADEPVTGLDVVTQAQILQLLLNLRDRFGTAILLISHNLPLIGRVADDLLVMYAGRIVEAGEAETLRQAPRHPYTQALLRAFPEVRGQKQTLATIEGEPADLLNLGAGCRFQPRCAAAFVDCLTEDPPLYEPQQGQRVACLLERAT
ncbi:MAG: ATP-binding cassette domain-containing protein, partial [Anaerolineae bacterium]|nr:ATP-binding cassette domain-containing protein [Anaerolineae bacterium]